MLKIYINSYIAIEGALRKAGSTYPLRLRPADLHDSQQGVRSSRPENAPAQLTTLRQLFLMIKHSFIFRPFLARSRSLSIRYRRNLFHVLGLFKLKYY